MTDIRFNLKMFFKYDLPGFFKRRRTSSIVFTLPPEFPLDGKFHTVTGRMDDLECIGQEGLWNKHTYWTAQMSVKLND